MFLTHLGPCSAGTSHNAWQGLGQTQRELYLRIPGCLAAMQQAHPTRALCGMAGISYGRDAGWLSSLIQPHRSHSMLTVSACPLSLLPVLLGYQALQSQA